MESSVPIQHPSSCALQEAANAVPKLLQIVDISVRFGGISALSNVTIGVAPGQIVGLIGPNGAGKTTLFDVVSGIRAPTSGKVHFDGSNITSNTAVKRSRIGIRRTFQRQQAFGWLSVEDNIVVALEGQGGSVFSDLVRSPGSRRRELERRVRAQEVMHRCGLHALKDAPASKLPIGLLRMVEFARAIISSPRLLLLDEPTSGLDEREAEVLGDAIRQTRDDDGCAIMLVEHDVGFVMAHCDRVVALSLGHVLAEGTPAEIRNDTAVRAAYLG